LERQGVQAAEERPQALGPGPASAQHLGDVAQQIGIPPCAPRHHLDRLAAWHRSRSRKPGRIARPWRKVDMLPLVRPGGSDITLFRFHGKSTLPVS
jgi:hypothetical protein